MNACPELENLFTDEGETHAKGCASCAAILAEHHALEHDLFKLSDPLPPASFVPQVMARVSAAPAPVRRELWAGFTVITASVGAAAAALFARPAALSQLGVSAADATRDGVALLHALPGTLEVLAHHAALPGGVFAALLMVSLFGLKKLAGAPALANQKVSA